jgi:spoIIIJ-associated protein
MREIERSAGSVDEAVRAALDELGVGREDVDVEIIDEGRSGFLGVGASESRVRVTVLGAQGEPVGPDTQSAQPSTSGAESPTDSDDVSSEAEPGSTGESGASEPQPEAGARSDGDRESRPEAEHGNDEWLDDQADVVADFLEDLFDVMDVRAEVEPVYEDGTMYVDVWTNDEDESLAVLIGRHGAALDALQEIVRGVVHNRTGERCQVVVDVEDYRKRRRAQLVSRARQAASRVEKSGRPERMDPMNAFERKIVHDAVANISGVQTGSEGEEPDRRVVISPA